MKEEMEDKTEKRKEERKKGKKEERKEGGSLVISFCLTALHNKGMRLQDEPQ